MKLYHLLKLAFGVSTCQLFLVVHTGAFVIAPGKNERPVVKPTTSTDSMRRFLSSSQGGGDDDSSAKVRFSGFELDKQSISSTTSTLNPFDSAVSFLSSDVGSIALGLVGLCVLLLERLSLPDATTLGTDQYQYAENLGEETRSNLIAVVACGSVLLNGISKLDVTSALAEAVELEGVVLSTPTTYSSDDNPLQENVIDTLHWGMESFVAATPAQTVVLLQNRRSGNDKKWEVMSMLGVVPSEATSERPEVLQSTPILDRFLKRDSRETYLPTLQALPGKTELTYIPANAQEVLILSVPTKGQGPTTTAILLGSNRAKSFTPRDVAWCQTVATRMGAVGGAQ